MENRQDVLKAFETMGEVMFAMRQGFINAGFTKPEANQMIRDMMNQVNPTKIKLDSYVKAKADEVIVARNKRNKTTDTRRFYQ